MKRIIALVLTLMLLTALWPAGAEEATKYDKLTVGTTNPFHGNFFSSVVSNAISDGDVRRLVHSYSLVRWDGWNGVYRFDPRVVSGATVSEDGRTYTLALNSGLRYNNGQRITAWDYAFSLLLQMSPALEEAAGSRLDGSRFEGYADYESGATKGLAGIRVMGRTMIALTLAEDFVPYFYELQALDVYPLPISVLAPGCSVKDNGHGVYIDGPLTAELLQQTLLDPNTGYMSHPGVTSGPYMLTSYDGKTAVMDLNPYYYGDEAGNQPYIPSIEFRVIQAADAVNELATGNIDLLVRCVRSDQITSGIELTGSGDISMASYARNGLAFISFCGEKGPTAEKEVRQAIAMCMDKGMLVYGYLGGYGIIVDGYYGLGQWMYLITNGTLIPNEDQDAEAWEALNLDGLTAYPLDTDAASALLDSAGWTLNEAGETWTAEEGGVRCKEIDGQLIPLKLTMIYPEGNQSGPMMEEVFAAHLERVGAELTLVVLPMEELLEEYYGRTRRDCDMILLGTNFGDVFDPYLDFSADGTNLLNGINDPEQMTLAEKMRKTTPGDIVTYCKRWIDFQNQRTATAMEIPLYSNAYFDFFITALQDYSPQATGNWSQAILKARLSDYEEEEEAEGGELPEEGDDSFFED